MLSYIIMLNRIHSFNGKHGSWSFLMSQSSSKLETVKMGFHVDLAYTFNIHIPLSSILSKNNQRLK